MVLICPRGNRNHTPNKPERLADNRRAIVLCQQFTVLYHETADPLCGGLSRSGSPAFILIENAKSLTQQRKQYGPQRLIDPLVV